MTAGNVAIRPARTLDMSFILDSFWRSFRESAFAEGLTAERLGQLVAPYLAAWPVLVAVDAADDDAIVGWCCARAPDLAYVFVKPWARRSGVCRALLSEADICPGVVFTPFLNTRTADRARAHGVILRFRPWMVPTP